MIGSEAMAKKKLKCLVRNCLTSYKYDIKIYDSNGLLVFNGKTNDYGFIYFEAKNWEVYKIEIEPPIRIYPSIIKKYFIFKENSCDTITFIFYKILPIVIKLIDKNYRNLPIEKGEIILWQDHIQLQ